MIDTIRQESKKIREWAIKANGNDYDLTNWCSICSYLIFKKLKARKLEPIFCSNVRYSCSSHCFVLCNGNVVDVTATQFGIKDAVVVEDIEIIKKKEKWFWDLENSLKFTNIQDIDKHLAIWDDSCNPQKKFRQKAA